MTDNTFSFLPQRCNQGKEPLMRITESESNDFVVCPACHANGGYKEVIEQGAGLAKQSIDKQLMDFIEQQWRASKLRG